MVTRLKPITWNDGKEGKEVRSPVGLEIRMKRIGAYVHISFSYGSGVLFVYRKRSDGTWDCQRDGKRPAVPILDGATTEILDSLERQYAETEQDYDRHTDAAFR